MINRSLHCCVLNSHESSALSEVVHVLKAVAIVTSENCQRFLCSVGFQVLRCPLNGG